ncbi:hypothetical protein [Geitlerinema sp. PCC 9228]|jgi:hypothetical protein|uniref:hypothetical protein n=1 Tax=Geitlerinema sp. PCC 9228 TaxID=111611 RepID=UPI0008F9C84F|nr:hypothetical protein [Geitlerinema sp. PCC 9228]
MSKKIRHHEEDGYIFIPDGKQPDRYIRIPFNAKDGEPHNHHSNGDDKDSEELGFGGFVVAVGISVILALILA